MCSKHELDINGKWISIKTFTLGSKVVARGYKSAMILKMPVTIRVLLAKVFANLSICLIYFN